MFSQHDKKIGISAIGTDGCLFMTLLKAATNFVKTEYTYEKIRRAYQYAIPDFMQDHRTPGKDRCFVIDLPEIVRIGFTLLGYPDVQVEYLYRNDNPLGVPKMIIGKHGSLKKCNFFFKKVLAVNGDNSYKHFLECTKEMVSLYNPGNGDGKILSLRGMKIRL